MKAIFYTLILLVSFASCKSVEKMVEKGEYDKAFSYAINKLQGEENKKTEYVKALEKAYFKLNNASLREIEKLNPSAKPENWSRVLSIYKNIENRQDRLDPLIPLVSESGYVASFDMKGYRDEINVAEDNTCLYYYNNAISLLEKSEKTGDKIPARKAYDELKKIESLKSNYRNTEYLKDNALELGLTKIFFEINNELRDFHGNGVERDILNLPVSRLDDIWHEFRINESSGRSADFIIFVDLLNIDFSPERERANTYSDSKEILIRKEKVKEKRDSVEVWVEREVYEKVRADITEVFREKKSGLHGGVRIINTRTKETIKNIPINVYHDFNGYGCGFIGDERALTDESRRRMDNYLEFFPSDFIMVDDLSEAFKSAMMSEVKRVRYE